MTSTTHTKSTMKQFTYIFIINLLYAATCQASPLIETKVNYFTVTEYSNNSVCEGPHTAQTASQIYERSGCKDLARRTRSIRWDKVLNSYVYFFSQTGCRGPIKLNITEGATCLSNKLGTETLRSFEVWPNPFTPSNPYGLP